jgi:hypothetical protein
MFIYNFILIEVLGKLELSFFAQVEFLGKSPSDNDMEVNEFIFHPMMIQLK